MKRTINPNAKYGFQLIRSTTGDRSQLIVVTPYELCKDLQKMDIPEDEKYYVLFLFCADDLLNLDGDDAASRDLFMSTPIYAHQTFLACFSEPMVEEE